MYSWAPACAISSLRSNAALRDRPHDLLLCIADHFEPGTGRAPPEVADRRVESWCSNYPRLMNEFRDSDGIKPQHSFFYPIEMYRAAEVDRLAELCRSGFGEVEVHLHHDNDTAENLRRVLTEYCQMLRARHGLLARDKSGRTRYAFIHGNWALDNSLPGGRHCGVNNELDVLRQTGCYADFTLPSYPSPSQTKKINSIYYAVDDPHRPKSHNWGRDVGDGPAPADALMMIQGPLTLDWSRRKFGIVPRIENGHIQFNQLPTAHRLDLWLQARVHIPSRPDWIFVKLYTHGAPEWNQAVLLGDVMTRFHEQLSRRAQRDRNFRFHYVTARQMYNLARAAEAGWTGEVNQARDFEMVWQPWATPAAAAQ
jgi:hypothetical protein